MRRLDRFEGCSVGATLIEYVLLAALIVVVCIVGMTSVGGASGDKLNTIATTMNSAKEDGMAVGGSHTEVGDGSSGSGGGAAASVKSADELVSGGALVAGVTIDDLKAVGDAVRADQSLASGYASLVGCVIDVPMADGTTKPAVCIGVGHEGEGLTFMMQNTIVNQEINSSYIDTFPDGKQNFESTEMYAALAENGSIYSTFSSDFLKNDVTAVQKKVAKNYNSAKDADNITILPAQKLWLLSWTEVGFSSLSVAAGSDLEGTKYTYFTDDASRKATGTSSWWWLRSANCDFRDYWGGVYSDGYSHDDDIDNTGGGARPCFTL